MSEAGTVFWAKVGEVGGRVEMAGCRCGRERCEDGGEEGFGFGGCEGELGAAFGGGGWGWFR